MKKVLALATCFVMATSLLASCGTKGDTKGGDKDAQTTISLGVWDKKQKPMLDQLVEAYAKKNPKVKVEIQLTPYKEYWTKLEAAATGGTAPDVFWVNVLHLDSYKDGGILHDLTDAVKKSDIEKSFAKTLVENYVREGKNYGVPKDFDTNALWYNKALFDKAGVKYPTDDMTYEDLVKKCEELKAKLPQGVYPFACPVDFQTWYHQTIYANGGFMINKEGTKTGYADPKTQAGIQCWIDLIKKGYSPTSATLAETSADAMFEGQQIAMNFAGSYMVPEYSTNDTIKDKIDCVEIPTFNGMETNTINGLAYAVYEKSKNKDAATDFAIWLSSAEAMKIQGQAGAVISARTDAQGLFADALKQYHLGAYTKHMDKAFPLPVCKKASEIYRLDEKWLTKAYSGEMPLAEACTQLQAEADKLLK